MANLKKVIFKILNEYQAVYTKVWESNSYKDELLTYFNTTAKEEVQKVVRLKNSDLLIDSSTGTGRTTKTPWIAVLDKRITTKASEGTYIVYLFNKDEKSVYLALEQSITEAVKRAKNQGASGRNLKVTIDKILSDEKQRVLNYIDNGSFITDTYISTGKKDFDKTAVMYKKYSIESLPNESNLEKDLHEIMGIYGQYYEKCILKTKKSDKQSNGMLEAVIEEKKEIKNNDNEEERMMVTDTEVNQIVYKIHEYIKNRGYVYSKDLIKNYYLSLKSKPFVILAGISGTGKSKLVKLFADAIGSSFKMVPVRPDWSDSTDLFGHLNLEGIFIEGPITSFIAEANSNLNKPYILCLDEMNLARVEYYFSDFLSVIETRNFDNEKHIVTDKLLSDSIFGTDDNSRNKYKDLFLSENIYIVGTVNMDETTFPFSKKVLDRANTIEFSDVNMELGLEKNKGNDHIPPLSVDNSFMKSEYLSIQICFEAQEKAVSEVVEILTKVNEHLKKINAQVAYRVRDEISYYVTYSQKYDLLKLSDAIDNALLQKVLPRIQGSSMALKDVLTSLFHIAVGSKEADIQKADNDVGDIMQNYLDKNDKQDKHDNIVYPKTAGKIAFMMRRFEDDGYTSFWL